MTPSDKDFAQFAQLGLHLGLLKPAQVQDWVDRLIAERELVPDWAVDLSTADLNEMIAVLNTVPGEISGDMPVKLLVFLIRQLWRNGKLSLSQVRKLDWQLHSENRLEDPDGGGDWGVVLECECEGLEQGYHSEAEIRASIEDKLTRYAEFEAHLGSSWSQQPSKP